MTGITTLGGGIVSLLSLIGTIGFAWVPATLVSLTMPQGTPLETSVIITEPVTAQQVSGYLARISTSDVSAHALAVWGSFVGFSILISLILAAWIIYNVTRIFHIRILEEARFEALQHTVAAKDIPHTHLRWAHVKEQMSSDSEQNWRLAILEADIMLNELLDLRGYRGETMGDKMKQIDRADFNSIDAAWDAHKVRNKIAHEGASMHLSDREARRVIDLYEQVFREFKVVE